MTAMKVIFKLIIIKNQNYGRDITVFRKNGMKIETGQGFLLLGKAIRKV